VTVEERIREALAEHWLSFRYLCDGLVGGGHWVCPSCGIVNQTTPAHQAAIIAKLVRAELFEAWEQGRDSEFARSVLKRPLKPNPYQEEQ
jgi:hypothetical protein